jgi:outer membrane biosynthesis protein TonB
VFKNKGFLYGLGIGLILGACLLQLMNFAVLDNKTISNGISSPSPSSSISPSPVQSPTTKATVEPIKTTKPTQTVKQPELPTTSVVPSPKVTKTAEPVVSTPKVTKTETPVEPTPIVAANPSAIEIIIERGMTSSEVASLLFNKGIISDEKAFDDSLSHLKLDRIIRIGTFVFLPNEKDSDIINKITTHK